MHSAHRAVVALALTASVLAQSGPHSEDEQGVYCSTTIGNNNPCSDYRHADENFLPYDIYYNGTISFTFTPGAGNASSGCVPSNNSASSAWLSIGSMLTPDKKTNRSNWDANPYYFHLVGCSDMLWRSWFNPNASDYKCYPSSGGAGFQSSTSNLYWGQAWTISATKSSSGDGYDLSGNLTTKKTNTNDNVAFALDQCTALQGRHASYSTDAVLAEDAASMTGHITPTTAEMTVTLKNLTIRSANFGHGETISWTFKGSHWDGGAKLLTNDAVPLADGQAKLKVSSGTGSSSSSSSFNWHRWYIYVAIGVVTLILVGWLVKTCVCGCCGFTPKKKQAVGMAQPQVYQLPQVNQQAGAYKGPQVYTQPQYHGQ